MSSSVAPSGPATWPDAAPPAVDTPLFGRDELVRELTRLLVEGERRVIALSGLGGVGKTRLAIEVARTVAADASCDGRVIWVSVAHAARDGGLASAVAAALDLGGGEPDHLAEAAAATIGEEPALLVLDSVETALHDLGLVDELLDLAPALRILLTSRIPIARPGVLAVVVEPLDVPRETDDVAAIAASPAVRLLLARAAAAGADVAVTEPSAGALASLVAHLDGIPLAIEIAGPLLRVVPPHLLLGQARERLDPVRGTVEWSHDHLTAEDRVLYRRIAVFGVPFRARHVRTYGERAITHGLAPLPADVAGGLERLAAAGLIRARPDEPSPDPATGPDDPRGGEVREYELPPLVREDAVRRLEASGEGTAAMWARANDLLALAELSQAELLVRSREDLLDQLDIVHDDVVAALDRARAAREGRFLLRLTGAMAEYWRARGRLAEGRIWLDAALRIGSAEPTSERARALHGAGMLANWQSDFGRARTMLEEALAIRLSLDELAEAAATLNQLALIGLETGDLEGAEQACRQGLEIRRSIGDEAGVAGSLNTLGGILHFGGRTAEARAMFDESLAIRRGLGDDSGISVSLGNLGLVARDERDLAGAEAMLREAIATRERLGDRQRVAVVRHNLALVLFDAGDLDGARSELQRALTTARELGDRLETANALSDLGFVEETAGRLDRAAALQGEALTIAARIEAKGLVAQAIDGAAGIVALRGDAPAAATLWSAAMRIRHEARYSMLAADRRRVEAETEAARAITDATAWDTAWAEGEALTLDEAIARARDALGIPVPTPRATGRVAV
jgi:predicted ATPase/Tfp pilus assembly protein PilF